MVILPACSAEKKNPFFSTEGWLEDPSVGEECKGVLRFFVGARPKGPPPEPPGPVGG